MTDEIRTMFDRVAPRYSLVNALTSFGRDASWRRRAVAIAAVQPGDRLLDVCCGPGEFADAFAAAAVPPARIVATDFSPKMLAQAQRRQSRRRQPIELLQADALRLPLPDGSFEVVSCAFGLRNLPDWNGGLAEFVRVLAPGGRLVILDFAMPAGRLWGSVYRFYFRRVLPRLAGWISGQRSAYEYLPRSVESFLQPTRIADMLKQVGLDDVRQKSMTLGVAVATVGVKR